jgi:hypothetical protein
MTELEARLRTAAAALDASAPPFDASVLAEPPRRRVLLLAAAVLAAVIAGVAAQPDARSAAERFLGITTVDKLGPPEANVAPGILGMEIAPAETIGLVPFPIRGVAALGPADHVYGRYDVDGGMVSLLWNDGVVLTQWQEALVDVHVTVAATGGEAEAVAVGARDAVWVAGEARGTFTVTGADGALHHEAFRASDGTLLWSKDGVGYLLQGAGSKERALQLAASVR